MPKCVGLMDYDYLAKRCNESNLWLENNGYCPKHSPKCENCGENANVYAIGKYPGDWGGNYCLTHTPKNYLITDRYNEQGE
jgi:hypothetical protein